MAQGLFSARGPRPLERDGFVGFAHMSDVQLAREMEQRGLGADALSTEGEEWELSDTDPDLVQALAARAMTAEARD